MSPYSVLSDNFSEPDKPRFQICNDPPSLESSELFCRQSDFLEGNIVTHEVLALKLFECVYTLSLMRIRLIEQQLLAHMHYTCTSNHFFEKNFGNRGPDQLHEIFHALGDIMKRFRRGAFIAGGLDQEFNLDPGHSECQCL